jgi:hypothetical protein
MREQRSGSSCTMRGWNYVNMNKAVLEEGDFEVCVSGCWGPSWSGVTVFRQWYVGCGEHGVIGAVLYGGWGERMLGERVIVGWLGEGGGGGVELVSGGALRCGAVCCGLRCARFDVFLGRNGGNGDRGSRGHGGL